MYQQLTEPERCLGIFFIFQSKRVLTMSGKCCVGSNSKTWRQPAYLNMEGAHGLLDEAKHLLAETALAKPQRRC